MSKDILEYSNNVLVGMISYKDEIIHNLSKCVIELENKLIEKDKEIKYLMNRK